MTFAYSDIFSPSQHCHCKREGLYNRLTSPHFPFHYHLHYLVQSCWHNETELIGFTKLSSLFFTKIQLRRVELREVKIVRCQKVKETRELWNEINYSIRLEESRPSPSDIWSAPGSARTTWAELEIAAWGLVVFFLSKLLFLSSLLNKSAEIWYNFNLNLDHKSPQKSAKSVHRRPSKCKFFTKSHKPSLHDSQLCTRVKRSPSY